MNSDHKAIELYTVDNKIYKKSSDFWILQS